MDMEKIIEGKVAKILDEYSIVINVGRNNGVTEGMIFVVFVQSDDEIKDPDSGETLGKVENVKDYVYVAHVQDKFSTCVAREKKKLSKEVESMGAQTLSGAMMAESITARPRSSKISTEKLNVNTSQVAGVPQLGPISVGDRVRAVGVSE
ncbi:MAG: hypothetical protein SCARUB_02494 [Candidatus Scalindua rubra]|uniref:Uncharacterized protein n=1 Tax=Candidatus Scalindua rubra TaxID=1872076 RepID=A0A1E3X9U1_9BACT|nr:MAG: hypothetical protein SCARUB_02494 [Candidatus Scalindua rubra]